jgi:transglutaminase-like putative cysteine protease
MLTFRGLIRKALPAVAILSVLGVAGLAIAAPAAKSDGDSIARFTGPREEQWLAQAVYDELRLNAGPEKREALSKRLQDIAMAWLATGRTDNFEAGNEFVHAMRACTYLAMLESPLKAPKTISKPAKGSKSARDSTASKSSKPSYESKASNPPLAQWLLDHAEVRRLLFRSLADVDSPETALIQFAELQAAEPQKVLEYPNLAVAFATARKLHYNRKQPKVATTVESFNYYSDPKRQFRYDLKEMPFELSRYLADTRLNIAERDWAARKYFRTADLGPAYFDVKYDNDSYMKKVPKKIDALDFTLPNLFKVGGVCIEQAYYASEVAKALGVPAAIVYGKGESGIEHAWFTYFQLNPAGTSASWAGGAGRYQNQLYFTGNVFNPATGKQILDSELVLVGAAALLPLKRREQAESATALAKIAAEACREGGKEGDVEPLKALAADYQARQDQAKDTTAPKVMLDWVKAKNKIDTAMIGGLLDLAIQRNIAYGQAWQTIVSLRKEKRLSVAKLDSFFNVLIGKTAEAYPEQSCQMILELVPTLEEPAKRDAAYKKSLAVYGRRPDLKGKILLAIGDEAREKGDAKQAIRIYQAAAMECVAVPDIVLPAAAKAEELLVADKKKDEAMRMYQALFAKTSKEDCALEIRKETSNYKLGTRLAELLREAGNKDAAEKIMSSL